MSKLRKTLLRSWLLFCLFLLGFPARADIVFPARLQLTETTPGTFQVIFILPVINGKILKAQPVLPEFCTALSQPSVQVDAFQKKTQWEIRCAEVSLHGQQIGIDGLLGSPIDVILEVNTLDGRTFRTTLSPNESYYEIPPPPGLSEFLSKGTLTGARNILLQWSLAFMFLSGLLCHPALRFRKLMLVGLFGIALGHFLSTQELLLIPSWAGSIAGLLVSLALLVPRAVGLRSAADPRTCLALIGLGSVITGGGFPLESTISGYTTGEMSVLGGFGILGMVFGGLILGLLLRQVLSVISLKFANYELPMSKGFASLALGMLIWKGSLFWNYPSMLPSIPWALLGFVLSVGLWMAFLARENFPRAPQWVLYSTLLGYLFGIWDVAIPYSGGILLAFTATFMILIYYGRTPAHWLQKSLLFIGCMAAGNYLFMYADESLSYPIARSIFFGLLLILIGLFFTAFSGWIQSARRKHRYFSASAIFLLVFAVLAGAAQLGETFSATVGFNLSEGRIPIPYLSLALGLIAILIWPRYRKIHRKMGVERRAPVWSLVLLTTAIFFLPVTAAVRNPWYAPGQLDEAALQQLMERKLWSTYTAFNIADEDALFEQLSENLDEDLLDHIYLDSRRRLTMGLREGSVVTVKEVSLDPLGTPESDAPGTAGWKYPATWTVTARVKHLKHIHYRKNQYTGTISLKPIDNEWKISEIILTSEDRQVIAAGSL